MITRCQITLVAIVTAVSLVAGCVGPPYVKPNVDTPSAFKEGSPAAYAGADAGAWQPAQPQDAALKGKWWEVFGEPELNALEEQLDINNQNIAQFFQNFMAAREQVSIARANYFPTVTAAPSATRTHSGTTTTGGTGTVTSASGSTSGTTFNTFQLP